MKLFNIILKYKFFIMITLIALIIFALGLFVINKYIYPRTLTLEGMDNKSVKLIMFHVTWCPYCKTAKPIWNKITENYNNTQINGKQLKVISLDCTDDSVMSSEFNNQTIEKVMTSFKLDGQQYNIEGYPTILLIDNNNNIIAEFTQNTSYENIEGFIKNNL
jgi:thiol-disulfide isomerase/thioredoxin